MVIKYIDMTAHAGGLTKLTCVVDGDRSIIGELVSKAQEAANKAPWELVIRRLSKGRSKNANDYAWVLIDKLAEKLRLTKEEVYQNVIREIGGVSEMVYVKPEAVSTMVRVWKSRGIGWQVEFMPSDDEYTCLILYYGSSVYTTEQMSALIDQLIVECKAQGIETMTPRELASLKGYTEGSNDRTGQDNSRAQDGA